MGIAPVHRPGGHNLASRRRDKILEKRDWFRKAGNTWKRKLAEKEQELKDSSQEEQAQGLRGGPNHTRLAWSTPAQAASTPNSRVEGVMFVPHTPDGGLARAIQMAEDSFAELHQVTRVRIVERGGTRLQDLLGRKNPWTK